MGNYEIGACGPRAYEFRYVFHNNNNGTPAMGSVQVGENLFQKLQTRYSTLFDNKFTWSDWKDVPHTGMEEEIIK